MSEAQTVFAALVPVGAVIAGLMVWNIQLQRAQSRHESNIETLRDLVVSFSKYASKNQKSDMLDHYLDSLRR